jgi:hypothetical protein
MDAAPWNRYVFLTDGTRYLAFVKVVVTASGVYVIDPNDPGAGKMSYHESGAINLGQPRYDPQVVVGDLGPPEAVHGYQYISRRGYYTHDSRPLPETSSSSGPSSGRPGPVIDVRDQPAGTRMLEVEIGIRCPHSCHTVPDSLFPSRRFLREETPVSTRLLVISASWLPLFQLTEPPK